MTIKRLALPLLAATVLLTVAAVAYAKTYDVPSELGSTLDSVDAKTPLAILLPSRLALSYDGRTYASGGGDRTSYGLSLTSRKSCGANSCFLVTFGAERGGTPSFRRTVKLRGGRTGYFKPLSCGGSCSPPIIEWTSRGNLYRIQANIPDSTDGAQERRMVAAANSAIGAGPR